MVMRRKRAERRASRYRRNAHCEVIDPTHTPDPYAGWSSDNEGTILYSGGCWASPGNMWPFEIPEAAVRQGRGDLLFYIPRQVENLTIESIIRHGGEEYEIIGYAPLATASASTIITARRMRL